VVPVPESAPNLRFDPRLPGAQTPRNILFASRAFENNKFPRVVTSERSGCGELFVNDRESEKVIQKHGSRDLASGGSLVATNRG
jgi:hypothetical protein